MPKESLRSRTTAAVLAVAAAIAVACGGCALFGAGDRRPTIGESQLNWLEIRFLPGAGQPPVQLSLLGTGNIHIRRGTSPRIDNEFSQAVAAENWQDLHADVINIDPSDMRTVFQSFVDRGVLREPDKDFAASISRGVPQARIIGILDSEKVARMAAEPELVGFIRDLLRLFEENRHAAGVQKK